MSEPDLPNFEAGVFNESAGEKLLPVVTQDYDSGRVLMLAWMNRAAWEQTRGTGRAVYYSRSRRALWRKGDTSGHEQYVREIRIDCDGDAILLRVDQTGAACHEGYESCFFRRHGEAGFQMDENPIHCDANAMGSDAVTAGSKQNSD